MKLRTLVVLGFILVLGMGFTGCGGGDEEAPKEETTPAPETPAPTPTPTTPSNPVSTINGTYSATLIGGCGVSMSCGYTNQPYQAQTIQLSVTNISPQQQYPQTLQYPYYPQYPQPQYQGPITLTGSAYIQVQLPAYLGSQVVTFTVNTDTNFSYGSNTARYTSPYVALISNMVLRGQITTSYGYPANVQVTLGNMYLNFNPNRTAGVSTMLGYVQVQFSNSLPITYQAK